MTNASESKTMLERNDQYGLRETSHEQVYVPLSNLSSESWDKVDKHIQKAQRDLLKKQGGTAVSRETQEELRQILRGIYHHLGSIGSKWDEIPSEYGSYITIYRYFRYWLSFGLIAKVDRLLDEEVAKRIKKIESRKATTSHVPTDFQIASGAIAGMSYWLEQHIDKLSLYYDYLSDNEQVTVIASLECEIDGFATLLKDLDGNASAPAAEFLLGFLLSPQSKLRPRGKKDHPYYDEARDAADDIAFHINHYLDKVVTVFDNLADSDKSTVILDLHTELVRLKTLLGKLKEVEQMTKNCQAS